MATTSSGLAEAISALQRRYGATAVRRGGDPVPAEAWPTGLPVLDGLIPRGGLPVGRVTLLSDGERPAGGPGATGRLTLLQALLSIASRSMQVAYVDLRGSLDPGYLADHGADLDACLVVRPPHGAIGPGLAMARTLVRAGVPWVGVALPSSERVAPGAWEHPLTALAEATWAARAVLCIAVPAPLPAPLAYASSLTLGCSPLGWQEAHGDLVGLRVRLGVAKSKVGAPGASAAVLLRYPRPHAVGEVVGLPALVAAATPAPLVLDGARRLPALAG
jgi:recA bacterial DNA recombination protein